MVPHVVDPEIYRFHMKKMNNQLYVGIDIGASRTKIAVINQDRQLIGHAVLKSGTDFGKNAGFFT